MKYIYTTLFLLISHLVFSQCNGRYESEIFNSVDKTTVYYPELVQWFDDEHKLDVYTPTGDTEINRPLIIFLHGGTFIAGDKENTDCVDFCETFAKKGYVTASVNYRLANPVNFYLFEETQYETVLQAVADVKAAIRYFRHDHETDNSYNIDPNTIFVGGSSAGAIIAIHLAYIDDISDLSTASTTIDLQTIANNNGGIDGDLGYANYSSEVSGVISFAGGIHNINWIDENDEPLVSIHGNNDGTVDYNCATVLGGSTPVNLSLCGSGEMHPRAESVNIINDHLLLNGSDHDWFNSGNGDSRFLDALDFTTDFLFPLLPCNQSTFTINQGLIKQEEIQSLDLLGRKNQNTKLLINIFNDGTTSKQIIVE